MATKNLKITEATHEDVPEIMNLVTEIRTKFQAMGINQWTESWPNANTFADDIDRGGVELVHDGDDDELVGFFVLNANDECADQDDVPWLCPDGKHLVIHRLGVNSSKQKSGIGTALVEHCENEARKMGCDSIRLDVFGTNWIAQKIYHRRGYRFLAERMCDRGAYYVMEKVLDGKEYDDVIDVEIHE